LADPLDLPFEHNAARLEHAASDLLAERFEIGGGRLAAIDEKVAVHGRNLGVAEAQAAAARLVDQLPGLHFRRVLERRAAGLLADRLRGFAGAGDALHLGFDRGRLARAALKHRGGEDDVLGRRTVTIGKAHVGARKDAPRAGPVEPMRFDQRVLDLAAVGAGVHHQRPADRRRARRAGRRGRRRRPSPRPWRRIDPARPPGAITRQPSMISTAPNARPPSRMTTPATPPSRTMRFEPRPIVVTGVSRGNAART
jgi:hypothetical protein